MWRVRIRAGPKRDFELVVPRRLSLQWHLILGGLLKFEARAYITLRQNFTFKLKALSAVKSGKVREKKTMLRELL